MIYLALSIFFTVLVFVILKEFNRYQLDNFQAIIASYFLAFTIGVFFSNAEISVAYLYSKSWVYGALLISTIFIIVFNLMAITAQKGGLSVMTIAGKMGMVIPITAGVLLYNDELDVLKVIGILLALLGVWFTCKKDSTQKFDRRYWYLPFFIFIGAGIADTLLNHMQTKLVPENEFGVFSTSLFFFCGIIGLVVLFVKLIIKRTKLSLKSWVGGLTLGVPNYFSIYFLVKALSQKQLGTRINFFSK